MAIFINNKSAKFCQITLHSKIFIHKRKVVLLFCLAAYVVYIVESHHPRPVEKVVDRLE